MMEDSFLDQSFVSTPFGNLKINASENSENGPKCADSGICQDKRASTTESDKNSYDSDPAGTRLVTMPEKLDPNRYKPARVIPVQANMFEICMNDGAHGISIYRYDITINVVMKNGEKDLSKGSPNDYLKQVRQDACWNVFQYLIEREKSFFGDKFELFYDRSSTLYSVHKLHLKDNGTKSLTIGREEVDSEPGQLLVDAMPPKALCLIVRLTPALQSSLLLMGEMEIAKCIDPDISMRDRSLVQFLELATTQEMCQQQSHVVFGNKAYSKSDSGRNLGGGKWLANGFEKNVRFVGNDEFSAIPVVQIDTKKSAFFSTMVINEFACNHLKVPMSKLHKGLGKEQRKMVAQQLRGLMVKTHLDKVFEVYGLTDKSASEIIIDVKDMNTMSVADFFEKRHKLHLEHPQLPCVIERHQTSKGFQYSYHPMELCQLRPKQRVDIKKQTPEQVEKMIKDCASLPLVRLSETAAHLSSSGLDPSSNNRYLANLQLSIQKEAKSASASILHSPTIVYGHGDKQTVDSFKGTWQFNGKRQFVRPAGVEIWAALLLDSRVGNEANQFMIKFVAKCQQRGMLVNPPNVMELVKPNADIISQKLTVLKQDGVTFILCISSDRADMHDVLKESEVHTCIVTQNILVKTMRKALGTKGAGMVLDNVVMKTNLKLGGLCHSLESSADFLRTNRLKDDILNDKWLRPRRMFVGLDVSHPAPQSREERRLGLVPKDPSVVGLCINGGVTPLDLIGSYWFQMPHKEAIIDDLDVHFCEAVKQFERTRGFWPDEVVVFRDGVSEGQYQMVMVSEQKKLRQGLQLAANSSTYRPRLTILVLQKRGNYRILPLPPTGLVATEQNVPPGTCVDTELTHPTHTEFIITPHLAIQGSARPIRCTVLVDDSPRLSMEDLEGTMYTLCYAHEIVNSPTSLPAPLYGAHELAKRGRNNYRVYSMNGDSLSSGCSSRKTCNSSSLEDDPFDKATTDLQVVFKSTKFWA